MFDRSGTMTFKALIGASLLVTSTLLAGCNREPEVKDAQAPVTEQETAVAAPDDGLPAALSLDANQKFLADSRAKPGTIVRPSGLQYRVLEAGAGASPTSGDDLVTVTYKGWTIDGAVFDQTPEGQTAQFPAGQLIAGWVEALSLMKEGDSWEIVLPSDIAYGEAGAGGGAIPPNQTLVFQMKLISVTPAPQ
jgi:FKBP-type peptidyl-prolyl cis-trans isomerase FklB